MPVKSDARSRTKSAVAEGTIDIRENPTQDISALSRDTENALNELGRIFDKKKIEEQQELAAVFGEEAFRLAHNMKDDGSRRKIIVHAAIAGLMSRITGAGFTSGAVAGGLNEALINSLKGLDPGTAQIVSAIIGAAAAKVAGGSAAAGASAAATGTKWNSVLTENAFVREAIRDNYLVHRLPEGYCNFIKVSGGEGHAEDAMIMVFNVEGTPVYSTYSLGAGASVFPLGYTMGRGYLEDPNGNIVTDPNVLKEQLTEFSNGWSVNLFIEYTRSYNLNGYTFVSYGVSTTPSAGLSASWTYYEGEQKDF